MINFTRGWLVAFFVMLTSSLWAQKHAHFSPPAPYPIQVVLPDGQGLHIIAKGNDHTHWTETTDGYTILKNKEGYYEYAIEKNGQLINSGIRASDPEGRPMQGMRQLLNIPKHLSPAETKDFGSQLRTLAPLSSANIEHAAVPAQGKVKLLAICIEFPDLPHSKDASYFSDLLNNGVDGKPSFKEYYLRNSHGKLDMSVDVIGWVKASKDYAYYGDENGKSRSQELVKEAIRAAEAQGVDYSEYDNDQDNDVDAVIIIHSGPGAEEGGRRDYVWSHRWTIPSESYDGKSILDYTIQPETRAPRYGGSVGIGIFCHEFGHLLGLPDLYDTESFNGNSHGIGEWGLMGLGQWLGLEDYPAAMSAWSKEKLGWVEAVDITKAYGQYTLKAAAQHPQVYRIETGRSNEYFLLENRQKQGFDEYLKGQGLAIWHINASKTALYPQNNGVNGDALLKGVDLEEADGNEDLDLARNRGDGGDLYPGITQQKAFNAFTNPTSESYFSQNNNKETGISIENITELADGTISFTHNRLLSNEGEDCDQALMGIRGENSVSTTPSWYEFTMPVAGGLQIATQAAGRPTSGAVYLSCESNSPIAEATSKNDASEYNPIYIEYLPKGQKVLIQWKEVAGQSRPFTFSINVEGSVSQQDSLALVAMYNQMSGASWSKKGQWLSGPVSSWQGVSVVNRRVTKLEFDKAGLKGNLPIDFYNLKELRSLTFIDNEISGGLDSKLGQLNKLEEIIIKEGRLSASLLSSVSSLKQLKKLSIVDVRLNENIPANIDQLTQLEHLEMHNAALTGSIPSSIGKLTKLKVLILSNNQLSGSIPGSIGSLWGLQSFRAENNRLGNAVPSELMTLPALQTLSLENNQLNALPEDFFSSNVLTSINLSRNQIGGNLPTSVNRTSSTALGLNLSKNQLKGIVSEALSKINFSQLDLSENQLEGKLPALKVVSYLSIASNNFSALEKITELRQGSERLALWCQNNSLTFDDLLPNAEFLRNAGAAVSQRYSPQNTLKSGINQIVNQGGSATITLDYDSEVTSNRYAWSLNNNNVGTTQQPNLAVSDFSTQKAGTYVCNITNTQLPGLTLTVDDIQLKLRTKEEQTITVVAIPAKTFGDAVFDLQASSSANLPLTYSSVSGPVSLNGNKVTITGAGEARLIVSQAGDNTHHAAETEVTFTIAKATQTINDVTIPTKTFGEDSFSLDIRASSGLPVALTVESGSISLNNNVVTIEGVGQVSISARQEGNVNYLAATPKTINFEVVKASQTIDFPEIEDQVYGNDPLNLSPTASSGLPVNIRVLEGSALWNNQQLVILGAGEVVVEAFQAGNENYQSANPVRRTFEVEKAEQQLFFDEIMDRELGDPPLELEAYSSVEGLEVSFRIIEGDAEIIDGNILNIKSDGKITIEAFQPGNTDFQAAIPRQRSFFVTSADKQTQTIVLKDLPDTISILDQLTLDWTVSSGLEPNIIIDGPAELQNKQLSFTAIGAVKIRLEQKGNEEFNAAVPVEYSLWVTKVTQTISVTKPQDISLKEEKLELKAVSDSGLPVLFRVISGGVGLNGNTLALLEEGEVIIEAYQPGNESYKEAAPQRFSFMIYAVERLSQTISYQEIPDKLFGDAPFELDIASSSELPLTLEASGPVSLDGYQVTIEGAGEVSIRAFQAGNEVYAGSDTITFSFVIQPAPQTLQFELEKIEENIYLLKAISDANLPVLFEVVSGEAEIQHDTLFIAGEEKVEVRASQTGDANYLAAEPVSRVVESGKVTSTEDDLLARKIKIYPNPSSGVFELEVGEFGERAIRIYDTKGRLIHDWAGTWQHESVDLSSQAPGVYLMSIQEKGKTTYYRLIKQ
ncbi:M6 family metalloprotease domain-containing protein [Catalinimonas niigatensis]|uniref:M6 family metalloprotease domain-containing protein n=1 Tax=Catalinimonas niigatensis TaxID=1397264 RepID=UPI0026651FB4|nr:M6 family metalloprotease domain-containing protein [Catalinimonas niigatensis]WPP51731.1 M6 family metalloprotease domain-containing protein [Catalinimonas niigatensis]